MPRLFTTRSGLRVVKCRGMFHTATQNPGADHNQAEADDLHQRKPAVEEQRAIRIGAHKFDQSALDAVKEHVGCENLSREALPFREEYQDEEIDELRDGFIELRRMKGHVQRRTDQLRRARIREHDAPRQPGGLAVAATRSEAAEPADGVAERQTREIAIGERQKRDALVMRVEGAKHERAEESAIKRAAGLQSGESENIAGMLRIISAVNDKKPNLRRDKRDEDHVDAEIPDALGVDTRLRCVATGVPKAEQHA